MALGGTFLASLALGLSGVAAWQACDLLFRKSPRRALAAAAAGLVAGGLLLRVVVSIALPPFQAPDEEPHFNYVRYLFEHRALPVQTALKEAETRDWEYYQPPLYYLLLVPAYALGTEGFEWDTTGVLFLLRLHSILLWAAALPAVFGILKRLGVKDPLVRLAVLAACCLLPSQVFLSAALNNDNLLWPLAAWTWFACAGKGGKKDACIAGVALAAALWTKVSAGVLGFGVVVFTLSGNRGGTGRKKPRSGFAIAAACALAAWIPWLVRNQNVYGSRLPLAAANAPAFWLSAFEAWKTTLVNLFETFWETAGIRNQVRFLPGIGLGIALCALGGGLRVLGGRTKAVFDGWGETGPFLLRVLPAVCLNLALALYFGLRYGEAQGRFLFPVLVPLSLFLGAGLRFLFRNRDPARAAIHAAGFSLTYALAFTGYALAVLG